MTNFNQARQTTSYGGNYYVAPTQAQQTNLPPPSLETIKERIQVVKSENPKELGVRYPKNKGEGISVHFTSASPDLMIGYATSDNAWTKIEQRNDYNGNVTRKADLDQRYNLEIKKLANGQFEYKITFDSVVAGGFVSIGGREYFIHRDHKEEAPLVQAAGVKSDRIETNSPSSAEPKNEVQAPIPEEKKATNPQREEAAKAPTQAAQTLVSPQEKKVDPSPKVLSEQARKMKLPDASSVLSNIAKSLGSIEAGFKENFLPYLKLPYDSDYHIPSAQSRDKDLLVAVSGSAERSLPKNILTKLQEKFSQEVLNENSDLRKLFNATISAINEHASKFASVYQGSEKLQQDLGVPSGAKVLVARSGLGMGTGLYSEERLNSIFQKAFSDHFKFQKIGEAPPVSSNDMVVFQAFHDGSGGPVCLKMSVVKCNGENRADWRVVTYDASFREAPSPHVRDEINRNPDKQVLEFNKWKEQYASNSEVLEAASKDREVVVKQSLERLAKEKAALEVAAKQAQEQEAVLKKVGEREYRSSYQGKTIFDYLFSNSSVSAVDTRTGTFTVSAKGGFSFLTQDADGTKRNWSISSYENLQKLGEEDKKLAKHVLTTPYEDSPERSIARVLDLFPSVTYRPSTAGSFFYSPNYSKVELGSELLKIYPRGQSPEVQRKFLSNLVSALEGLRLISPENSPKILKEVNQ